MKIVLVQPDQIESDLSKYNYFDLMKRKRKAKRILPLGLLYIASSLQQHSVVFVDNYFQRYSNEKLLKFCLQNIDTGKGVVGFGGTCLEWFQAACVSKMIKKVRPDITTVYGGPNATARPEKHVNYFDYVIRGVGVDSFKLLINGHKKENISGLCWCGHIVEPCFTLDFSKNKWPTLKILEGMNLKINYSNYSLGSILSSIGCPFQCKFCAAKYIWNRSVFFRDADEVLKEVKYLKNKGLHVIHFREDNFTINKERLYYFCKELKKINIRWTCQSRIKSLDEYIIPTMKESGCREISCGFESINDSILSYVGKGHTSEDIKYGISLFEKYGMSYTGGFIVGFPNETKQEIINTCNFIKSIRKNKLCGVPAKPSKFLGIPVSELYNEVVNNNQIEYNWNDGELLFIKNKEVTTNEIDKLINKMCT